MQASAGVAALRHTVAKIIQDLNLQIQNIKLLYYKNVVSFFFFGGGASPFWRPDLR